MCRHDRVVEPIVLDRRFRWWRYGVGHSQLLLHAHADADHDEHVNVLFEGVYAAKLRLSYRPLILHRADDETRAGILAFSEIPARHQARLLCLALSSPRAEAGFVACSRATVLANAKADSSDFVVDVWTDHSRVLHALTAASQSSALPESPSAP